MLHGVVLVAVAAELVDEVAVEFEVPLTLVVVGLPPIKVTEFVDVEEEVIVAFEDRVALPAIVVAELELMEPYAGRLVEESVIVVE